MTTSPPQTALFAPTYYEPVNPSTQVDRIPGTPDAPCHCAEAVCRWPFDVNCWNRENDASVKEQG
jgi:hypothetical protein